MSRDVLEGPKGEGRDLGKDGLNPPQSTKDRGTCTAIDSSLSIQLQFLVVFSVKTFQESEGTCDVS